MIFLKRIWEERFSFNVNVKIINASLLIKVPYKGAHKRNKILQKPLHKSDIPNQF